MNKAGEGFKIISDSFTDKKKHITAIPDPLVCCNRIDFDIIDGKLHDLIYVKGCNGNLKALGRLLEGADIKEAARLLRGVDCKGRGTSCTDQLAKIIESIGA